MKQRITAALAALCCLLIFSGCTAGKRPGEGATINYHLPDVVTSIDPQTVQTFSDRIVVNALYEGLCRVDENGGLTTGVASRWEHSSDYSKYIFYLREDAVWNTGEPVTASDFIFAFTRALDPNTGSRDVHELFVMQNAREIYQGEMDPSWLGATALDEHTLQIELAAPDKSFPYRTAKAVYMPCDRSLFEESKGRYGLTYRTSCTNGPFSFVNRYSWEERKSMSLCESPTYTGSAQVYPAYIELTMGSHNPVEDPLAALFGGAVDAIEIPAENVEEARLGGCDVEETENTAYGILFNPKDPTLQIPEIRNMLFSTIDPHRVETYTGAVHAVNIIPGDVMWGGESYRSHVPNCTLPVYDREAAAGLEDVLAKNDLDSMKSLKILCADDPFSKEIANSLIVSWNAAFGTYFNMLPVEKDVLAARVEAGNYQIALTGFTADTFDPYDFLWQIGLVCPDEAYAQAVSRAASADDFYAAEQMLLDRSLFYPVYKEHSYFALRAGVSGIYLNRMTSLDFTKALKE